MFFEILYDVIYDILFTPISFLIGLLGVIFKVNLDRNAYKKRLKFEKQLKTVKCITANPDSKDNAEHVNLGYVFEYMSVGELKSTWTKHFKDLDMDINMSPSVESTTTDIPDENLLVIGGPFHNKVCKDILATLGDKLPFYWQTVGNEDAVLHYKHEGKTDTYTPLLTTDGTKSYYSRDYAIIVNIKHPNVENKRIILLIGCRSIGCYGGAVFFSQHLNKIKLSNLSDEYALIVKVNGEEDQLSSIPRLEKIYPINTQSI